MRKRHVKTIRKRHVKTIRKCRVKTSVAFVLNFVHIDVVNVSNGYVLVLKISKNIGSLRCKTSLKIDSLWGKTSLTECLLFLRYRNH